MYDNSVSSLLPPSFRISLIDIRFVDIYFVLPKCVVLGKMIFVNKVLIPKPGRPISPLILLHINVLLILGFNK